MWGIGDSRLLECGTACLGEWFVVLQSECLHLQGQAMQAFLPGLLDDDDNNDNAIFQNVGNHSLNDTASHPESSATVL